jgi:DNA-binding winged helix-turn-helix (wHTH) protein
MSELEPVVLIGDWQYQVIYGQLTSIDQQVAAIIRLEPQLHSLLNYFLRHPHVVLTKDLLLENVWPQDAGSDAAVMRAVGALRKVLGDDARSPRYIATVPKKGYRWLADITPSNLNLTANDAELTAQAATDVAISGQSETGLQPLTIQAKTFTKRRTDYVWSWRFVLLSTLALLVTSAGFAFVLSLYTTEPLLKLPDTITPISALNGEEYHPLLNVEQTQVIYQHKKQGEQGLVWVKQDLQSRRAHFLSQQYLALSAAQWADNQSIIYRGQTEKTGCGIYQQQLFPVVADPVLLWRCNKLHNQGVIQWRQQWLWLDSSNDNQRLELWIGHQQGPAELLAAYDFTWHKLSAMLLQQDTLLLLAHETRTNSVLLQVDLPSTTMRLLRRFTSTISDMGWWDKSKLLLSSFNQNLQLYDLKAKTKQDLGPISRPLVQASRYPGQVLATQYLNYTSDIYQVTLSHEQQWQLVPWQMSNRSEYLFAHNGKVQAFVSERSGVSQVWLQSALGQNVQVSNFKQQQQIQQLFWHKQQLMVVIYNKLYRLDLATGVLQLAKHQVQTLGRYASCQQQLFWTELTDDGWQLVRSTERGPEVLYQDVVDVRCGIEQQLIVQHVTNGQLAALTVKQHQVASIHDLAIKIDWRNVTSEQWFVDESGIYWLDPNQQALQAYRWQDQKIYAKTKFNHAWPLAIYSNSNGLGYVVLARPFDTDIVWLQQRR